MITLDLPTPPPTNNLFQNSARAGRIKSPGYRSWIKAAGWELQAARQKAITGAVRVSLFAAENIRRDLDGYWKPVLDLLVAHRLIEDDRNQFVRELDASWSSEVTGVRVIVRSVA